MRPVQDRVKPSFVIFDIRALWRSVKIAATKVVEHQYSSESNRMSENSFQQIRRVHIDAL